MPFALSTTHTFTTMINSLNGLNVGILFEDFGPYHRARIEAFSERLTTEGVHLNAFRMYSSSSDYSWNQCIPSNVNCITLCSHSKANVNPLIVAFNFFKTLINLNIKVVFLPSYSPLPNLLCFFVAKILRCKTVLMTESWLGCESKNKFVGILKRIIIPHFDSALVGGIAQKDYLLYYGFSNDSIFYGYNIIDVKYFESQSDFYVNSTFLNESLPSSYFLNLGRFVQKKNLHTLIEAYSLFLSRMKSIDFIRLASPQPLHFQLLPSLVIVGEGEMFSDLLLKAFQLGLNIRNGSMNLEPSQCPEIVFFPFQQIENVPMIMASSIAFILPSLWEEWGLVINEAMACRVPVVVSKNAGCTFELIKDGVTGLLFDPVDANQLSDLLVRCYVDTSFRNSLATHASFEIQKWRPSRFASGAFNALVCALN